MNAKDAIRSSANLSSTVLNAYISDLDDAELLQRPAKGCNHIAWQLGHLISSEVQLLESVAPGKGTELPEGFAEAHSKDSAQNDEPGSFLTKQEYVDLFGKVREGTMAALDSLPDAELDNPSPENFRAFAPTVCDMFALIATHPMMHAGQFVIVRRQLDKPILM